jgi:hypothetical protein
MGRIISNAADELYRSIRRQSEIEHAMPVRPVLLQGDILFKEPVIFQHRDGTERYSIMIMY